MADRDDDIIDITPYLRGDDEDDDDAVFTLWGGDAERARFALPLWRAAYLFNGRRSALVSTGRGATGDPEALTVLDLRSEQARTDFQAAALLGLGDATKPGTAAAADPGAAVFLGEEDERRWYLVVDDIEDREEEEPLPEPHRPMSDLLFLAGECAGLLFFRRLATNEHGWVDED